MKKLFSVRVDEDVIPFEVINCDENGEGLTEFSQKKIEILTSNPVCVEITNEVGIPPVGSDYDPETQTITNNTGLNYSTPAVLDFPVTRFVLVVNNKVACSYSFNMSTEQGQKFNAIFQSNPQIFLDRVVED